MHPRLLQSASTPATSPVVHPSTATAVIRVRAGELDVSGRVSRTEDHFVTVVDDAPLGEPAGLDFAMYRLITGIRTQLPLIAPGNWAVTVEGEREGKFRVSLSDGEEALLDADGAWGHELSDLVAALPLHTLSDAIDSAAQLARYCVRRPR